MLLGMILFCENACTVVAASTKEEFEIRGAAGKYNANHAPVISHQDQSQLHHDVVRALRTKANYSTFAALLDNMTESVIRQGITVFAPNNKALSDFQKANAEERLHDVIKFHIITVPMPFSNLLRLEAGSRLTTDVSNLTIQVTNTSASAYQVDDAVIVDPDLYTDATIAVHGINAVFNTSKIAEEGGTEETRRARPIQIFPNPTSHACKIPTQVKDVSVYQILMSVSVLCLLKLTVSVV